MLTVVAFVVALGLLIAVHEYGHYRVAVASGVKVLRFSVGFGKPMLRWKPRRQRLGQETEFVVGMFPFGGYVRMLDEREGPVEPSERHRSFNAQPVAVRAAIVAAGPVANLLLAVVLYATVNWMGVEEPQAILSAPLAGSLAEQAGLKGGETVRRAGSVGEPLETVNSFESLRWFLTRAALDGHDLVLEVAAAPKGVNREFRLRLSGLAGQDADVTLFRRIGIVSPLTLPVIGDITPGSPAERAGLRKGDLVERFGDEDIVDASRLRERIRASVRNDAGIESTWFLRRDGQTVVVTVRPEVQYEDDLAFGRIGAFIGARPVMVDVRYGVWDGLVKGFSRTWEISALTLRMMGRMVTGDASLRNISGPLTIADYAGRSAQLGLTYYLGFLALISVSLGVLNLLPLPVLDGGHLMYYLWESVTGRPIPDPWMDRLQRAGVAVLLLMMSIALFNDAIRILG